MLDLIILNSISFALGSTEGRIDTINSFNLAFTGLYLIEFLLKVVYRGLIQHKRAHLRTGWTYIDIAVILTG